MPRNSEPLPIDTGVLFACMMLFGIGLAALHSVSLASGDNWVERQLLAATMAVAAAAVMAGCSLSFLRRYVRLPMLAAIAGLLLVFLFEPRNGAQRWVSLGGLTLQPSEFCKWATLLIVAHFASRPQYKRRQLAFIRPVAGWLAAPIVLIILQPDFGALVLIASVALAVLFLSGLDMRVVLVLAALVLIMAALMVWLEPYRMRRLTSFVDPFDELNAGGYNQKHAIMAFVLGSFWGSGIGRGIEKWGYLPEPHNDFIIAAIAEETGLVGFMLVCGLLAFVAGRAIKIGNAAAARGENFGALYAFGFAAMLTLQSFINIGGNLALLPPKGFTLPLVSYGGSSLLATGLMLGVLLRVDFENRRDFLLARGAAA